MDLIELMINDIYSDYNNNNNNNNNNDGSNKRENVAICTMINFLNTCFYK